eukprot:CAMPEP_0117667398 /NCGR_PEP_ID=MMETSP0804-20121206/10941_1 /TAXON_ID=1074897 /ORGANISM="Tetraselmis astigmatica, Strain CCMP880" /LENGTH=560 /DNA_ID=CAMNT_0005475113 /DNA_START=52 /DNA_END=1735 /DNA_ORIENTATION=+
MAVTAEDVFNFFTSVYLLVVACVFAVLVFFFSLYILVFYQHPDDPDQSWWSKAVVLYSTWLVFYTPIFSAVDFAAVQNGCPATDSVSDDLNRFLGSLTSGGDCMIPTQTILYFLLFTNLIMSYWVIPFSIWIRKDIVEMPFRSRFIKASLLSTLQCGVIMAGAALLWYFAGNTVVPIKYYPSGSMEYNSSTVEQLKECIAAISTTSDSDTGDAGASCESKSGRQRPLQLGAVFTRFLRACAYEGKVHAVPPVAAHCHRVVCVVLLRRSRPRVATMPSHLGIHKSPAKAIDKIRVHPQNQGLLYRAADIKEKCMLARDGATAVGKHETKRLNRKFARDMAMLELEERKLKHQYPEGDDPERQWIIIVIKQYLQLIYGIIGAAVSVAWIVQVYFYSISDPPKFLGLNLVFILTGNFFFDALSLLLLVFFCFHLTICCIQGHYSVSMVFPCLTVHSLSVGITMIETFLVQCRISLLSAPAILAFQVVTLSLASANTNISYLFGFEFTYLEFWGFLMQSYVYLFFMLTCFFLTIVIGASELFRDYMRQSKERKEKAAHANVQDY